MKRSYKKCILVCSSYKTFRFERVASSLGMEPESLLLFRRLYQPFPHKLKVGLLDQIFNYNIYQKKKTMITGKLANLQESERLQLGKGLGDSSLKSVPIQIHADKALQIAQFFRDLALEVVPVKFPVFTEPNPTPNINQNPIFEPKTWIQEAKFKRRSAYRY